MKVGDLVTLSARGAKLEACWKWTRPYPGGPIHEFNTQAGAVQLIGLVVDIKEPFGRYDNEAKFSVRWVGNDGPKSRESWNSWRQGGYWHRSDLKFVAKAKVK